MKSCTPHAYPVESELRHSLDMLVGCHPRIDLEPDLGVRLQIEPFGRKSIEVRHLFRFKVGRRSAAPVELDSLTRSIDALRHAIDFVLQSVEIRIGDRLVAVDDDVAAAKPAQALTERDMEVERHRRLVRLRFRILERAEEIVRAKFVLPLRGRRVARVTRAIDVISVQNLERQADALALNRDLDCIAHPTPPDD